MNVIRSSLENILGLGVESGHLTFGEMAIRSVIIFIAAVVMIRLAGRRFMAQRNPLDAVLAFTLASMLARGINGSAAFFPTLGAGFVIAAFYRIVVFVASKSNVIGFLFKGEPDNLIKNGQILRHAMNRHQISHNDLMEDLHLLGHMDDVSRVKCARIERNGDISVLRQPQIFTVNVEHGVQTIKIQVE